MWPEIRLVLAAFYLSIVEYCRLPAISRRLDRVSGCCPVGTQRHKQQEQQDRGVERQPKTVRPRGSPVRIACEKEQAPDEEHYCGSGNHREQRSRRNDGSRNVYGQYEAGLPSLATI